MAVSPSKPVTEAREDPLDSARSDHEEGIRISFAGKDVARRIARKVQPRTSRRIAKYSCGSEEDQASNLVIEGENLQALVTLYRERGQVDLILTDPPYNTGQDFRYNDRWDQDPNDPDLGELVGEDDGARHTKWMKFMLPRLRIMREMLKPTGVLAICIDHRELFRLGQMLDELFKAENRLGIINWQKSYSPRNDNTHLSTATEYVLVYARDVGKAKTALLDRTEGMDARYTNPDKDPRGLWTGGDPAAGKGPQNPPMVYGIQSPFTGELQWPQDGDCWRSPKRNMKKWLEEWGSEYQECAIDDGRPSAALVLKGARVLDGNDGPVGDPTDPVVISARKRARARMRAENWPRLIFLKNGDGRPRLKRYLNQVKKGVVPMTYWADQDYDEPFVIGSTSWEHPQSGHSQAGINELDAIVGKGHGFTTVKPLKLFEKIVQLWCPPSGLVLDPFAGSGTTGHGVLELNAMSGAERRFILVEQGRPEKGDPYARSLLANRLRRVIEGDWANGKGSPIKGGFRFVQLQKRVDAKALLEMERDEMTDAVIASHYDINRRGGPGLILMTTEGYSYLVARNSSNEGFYLVWDGGAEPPVFDDSVYEKVVSEALDAGLKPTYHVYARFNLFQSDDVRFYQIPDQILIDFGLDINADSFNNDSDET